MDSQHLQELIRLEDSYWWHVAKRQLVAQLVTDHFPAPRRLVEGGVGSARNLIEFSNAGYDVAGFDILPEAVEHARSRGLDQVRQHDLCEPWPIDNDSVGVVVLLDVLEHLPDPVSVMRDVQRILKPGGGLVFTVPAYPWLFGDWDRRLGHFRRYTVKELRRHASESGLRVDWLSYWNAFSLPMAVAVRSYQRCFPKNRMAEFPRVAPTVNRMLLSAAAAERWCLNRGIIPFGLSLVGVLAK